MPRGRSSKAVRIGAARRRRGVGEGRQYHGGSSRRLRRPSKEDLRMHLPACSAALQALQCEHSRAVAGRGKAGQAAGAPPPPPPPHTLSWLTDLFLAGDARDDDLDLIRFKHRDYCVGARRWSDRSAGGGGGSRRRQQNACCERSAASVARRWKIRGRVRAGPCACARGSPCERTSCISLACASMVSEFTSTVLFAFLHACVPGRAGAGGGGSAVGLRLAASACVCGAPMRAWAAGVRRRG